MSRAHVMVPARTPYSRDLPMLRLVVPPEPPVTDHSEALPSDR